MATIDIYGFSISLDDGMLVKMGDQIQQNFRIRGGQCEAGGTEGLSPG